MSTNIMYQLITLRERELLGEDVTDVPVMLDQHEARQILAALGVLANCADVIHDQLDDIDHHFAVTNRVENGDISSDKMVESIVNLRAATRLAERLKNAGSENGEGSVSPDPVNPEVSPTSGMDPATFTVKRAIDITEGRQS